MTDLSPSDLEDLARAKEALSQPSLAIRIADRLGTPVEALVKRLPSGAQDIIHQGTHAALDAALDVALRTLAGGRPRRASDTIHRGLVVAMGAVGGATGLAGLLVELPLSTVVMLRSIADHARAQGEDLTLVETRLECLTVFAYGSRSTSADDAAESAYFTVRAALGRAVARAAEYAAERGAGGAAAERTAPALVHLISRIAQRFGVTVADKTAAQLIPVIGAAGGAAVNALFIDHYQSVARAHFTVRRLIRAHGEDTVRRAYAIA